MKSKTEAGDRFLIIYPKYLCGIYISELMFSPNFLTKTT